MDGGQNAVHLVDYGVAFGRREAGHRGGVKAAALNLVHDVKGRADDTLILAQKVHPGDGNRRILQRALHAKFPLYRMGGFQEHAGRFAAQDVTARGGHQTVGGRKRPRKAWKMSGKPCRDGIGIERAHAPSPRWSGWM